MVKPYAVIEDDIVVNIAVAEESFAAEQGWVYLPIGVGIGWQYDGSTFSAPAAAPPTREEQEAKRADAYRVEADPLFFQAQRGEATQQEWLDKIAEIQARFPYPAV